MKSTSDSNWLSDRLQALLQQTDDEGNLVFSGEEIAAVYPLVLLATCSDRPPNPAERRVLEQLVLALGLQDASEENEIKAAVEAYASNVAKTSKLARKVLALLGGSSSVSESGRQAFARFCDSLPRPSPATTPGKPPSSLFFAVPQRV